VELTVLGRGFVQASMDERKLIWRAQLTKLKLFRVVSELLDLRDGNLSREELIQEIAGRLPMEDPELTFETIVAWAGSGTLRLPRGRGVLTYS